MSIFVISTRFLLKACIKQKQLRYGRVLSSAIVEFYHPLSLLWKTVYLFLRRQVSSDLRMQRLYFSLIRISIYKYIPYKLYVHVGHDTAFFYHSFMS